MKNYKLLLRRYLYIIISSVIILNVSLASTAKAYKRITAEDLRDYMSASSALMLIIDVRAPEEYASSSIPSSVNIPMHRLTEKVIANNVNPNTRIVVYGSNQIMSDQAAEILESVGYTDVCSMGGIDGWDFHR